MAASDSESQRIHLVFGASGYVGRHLTPFLAEHGYPVRAAARRPRFIEARGWSGVEAVAADALDTDTLQPALAGVAVAYYLVHSMAAGAGFGELDLRAARNFRQAAEAAGVSRIVYLGGLIPEGVRGEHLRSRARTGEVLRDGTIPVTEIRAGIIIGPGSAAFESMRDVALHWPVVLAPRAARKRNSPVALANLLEYLRRAPELDATAGEVYDVGGPERVTYTAILQQIPRSLGRRVPPVVCVPGLSPRFFGRLFGLVTSVPAPIARALIEGMDNEFTTSDERLRRLVDQRLLPLRESVEAVFAAERNEPDLRRWVEGAFCMRERRHDYAYYPKQASGSHATHAPPERVWAVLEKIGGRNRYFYWNGLWTLREVLDWMAGGPGLERGRTDPVRLHDGDRVDSWKVIGVEPERRLTLGFGMKAPGAGVLEFELTPLDDGGTRLTATAYWQPAGTPGLMYWFALAPFHRAIFEGMTREICRRAEAL